MQGQLVNAKVNVWAFQRLLSYCQAPVRKLLDVGTGYGFFMRDVSKQCSLEATGVELSKQEALFGTKELQLDIKNSALSESGLAKQHFDMVTAFEVIEHVASPNTFVAELATYAKPGGFVLIMTDNFESKVAKDLGAGFPKWIPHSHISHFAPRSLEWVIENAGLVVEARLSYTPWELELRRCYNDLRGVRRSPSESFELSNVLETEMGGVFPFFSVRVALNSILARWRARTDLEGALMYILARKPLGVAG